MKSNKKALNSNKNQIRRRITTTIMIKKRIKVRKARKAENENLITDHDNIKKCIL